MSKLRTPRFSFATALCAVGLCLALTPKGAAAKEAQQCQIKGTTELGPDTTIVDNAGAPLATFTGAPSVIELSRLPTKPSENARIVTSPKVPGFRVRGQVDTRRVPIFTKSDVAIVPGNVWLQSGSEVRISTAQGSEIQIFQRIHKELNQTVKGWTSCKNLSLESVAKTPRAWPSKGRGYRLFADSIQIFDTPRADATPVFELERSGYSDGLFVWGTDLSGEFQHVRYQGDLLVDAWVKRALLRPLPEGEIADPSVVAPQVSKYGKPKLEQGGPVTLIKVEQSVPLRIAADPKAPVIGEIAPNTEVYQLDVVMGWASVLPKALNIAPPPSTQFYVPESALRSKEPQRPRRLAKHKGKR